MTDPLPEAIESSAHDDPIEAAWAQVEAKWDDDAAHKKFIALCATLGSLDAAGRRYRAIREAKGPRADSAERRIGQVLGMAMQNMELHREPPSEAPRRWILFLGLFLATLMVGTVAFLWSR